MTIHTARGARRALMFAGVSAAVLAALPAVAQEAPQAAEQASTLEEVVVTARRREERL